MRRKTQLFGPTNLKVSSPTKLKLPESKYQTSIYIHTTSLDFFTSLHFSLPVSFLYSIHFGFEMESYSRKWCVVFVLLALASSVAKAQQVPCYFIFGDSLVDNGNNNGLVSFARANYLPYGIDFGGPTGRFSNGRTTVDEIGMHPFPQSIFSI